MSDNRLDLLEQRLDQITAVNTYLCELVSALQNEISATRMEFLTLRNRVNRTHEQPSAVNFLSRVYRPTPIDLPRLNLRSNTSVRSLPVAVPVARAEALPLRYFHLPDLSFLHLPLRPYKKKKIRAAKTRARLAVALRSLSCQLLPASLRLAKSPLRPPPTAASPTASLAQKHHRTGSTYTTILLPDIRTVCQIEIFCRFSCSSFIGIRF